MDIVSPEDQQILDALRKAVAEALDRKQRLGQYAVVWREGRPVIIGEKAARYAVTAMIALQYLLVIALVATRFFTPAMLLVLLALIPNRWVFRALAKPKPERPPAEDRTGWPMWFVSMVFTHNRLYGTLFLAGLIADAIIKRVIL